MVQRGFKTDAEAARRQGVQCGRHGDFLLVPGGGQAFRADFAAVAFQRGDRGHVIRRQPQLLGKQVAGQVLAFGRRRDHGIAQLQRPGQRDLRRRGVMALGDLADHGVFQHLAVGQRHVGRDVDALAR
ncbi:hypothetical protein G6F62_015401 [Rhizopus arrhizus]|nr:hypothetical protein G6F62_015401 [Rhizopus arrhizus]